MFVGQKVGPFEIERELGNGAMGTVYQARFEQDGKPVTVALKVVAYALTGNDSAMARFTRESAILKQLRHPHIVRHYGTGSYKKTPFIAMEFVDGEALDRVLARRGRLGWEEVVTYGKQLCDALRHAHLKGIIHRDLKPSNLMVTRDGVLKLTDFGIAKDTDVTALTGANSTIGTAAYMSPEQCKGDRSLTAKSDLYSLGIVFYELLTGQKPFTADATVDMFMKHVQEVPVRPTRLVADVPVWLDNLVMFLLEKEKDKRPLDAATVGKMLADIEEKVQNQQSAGADLANARRVDRRDGEKLSAEDREIARSLKAATPGKKKKKKKPAKAGPPGWLKAIPVVAALAVVVGVGVFMFNRGGGGTAGGGGGTEATDQAAARGKELEGVLAKRLGGKGAIKFDKAMEGEDAEAFEAAKRAIEAEEKGDLGKAAGFWAKVKERNPQDKYGDAWGWLADKRAADAKDANAKLAGVKAKLLKQQADLGDWKFDPTAPESVAAVAVRLGGAGGLPPPDTGGERTPLPYLAPDPAKAGKAWADLMELTKDKFDQRAWFLLAAREKAATPDVKPDAAVATRKAAIAAMLAAVRAGWQRVGTGEDKRAERWECRSRLRDVVELYADEADAAIQKDVAAARTLEGEIARAG